MADKRLDQENVLTDFDYALIVKGADVAKISKADLAKVVGGLVLNELQNRTANASLVYTIGQQFNATRNTPYNIASARGRYQIIHRYSGTFCSFEFDGNSITNFKDGGAGWYKSSTNTDNFFNIYASGGKVCIKSMRDADSVFRFIVC